MVQFISRAKREYTVILSCYWLSGIVGLNIKKAICKNLLISFCSLGVYKKNASANHLTLEKRILAEIMLSQKSDHIIATTQEEKKIIENEYNEYKITGEKISVIPRGVDLNVFYKY